MKYQILDNIMLHLNSQKFPELRFMITARTLRDEKVNSPTRLLVATWAYRVSNIFGKGSTQRKTQESYSVRAKQLAACNTGRKYLGGAERKRRLSRADDGTPLSKKFVTPSTSQQ